MWNYKIWALVYNTWVSILRLDSLIVSNVSVGKAYLNSYAFETFFYFLLTVVVSTD